LRLIFKKNSQSIKKSENNDPNALSVGISKFMINGQVEMSILVKLIQEAQLKAEYVCEFIE